MLFKRKGEVIFDRPIVSFDRNLGTIPRMPESTSINVAQTVVILGGAFNTAFAVFHLFFWRLFDWKRDLTSLTFINRQVIQVLNLCLIFTFFIFAYISFFFSLELLTTELGRTLLFLIATFWFLRAVEQVVYFRLRRPVSVGLLAAFIVGGLLYSYPVFSTG